MSKSEPVEVISLSHPEEMDGRMQKPRMPGLLPKSFGPPGTRGAKRWTENMTAIFGPQFETCGHCEQRDTCRKLFKAGKDRPCTTVSS